MAKPGSVEGGWAPAERQEQRGAASGRGLGEQSRAPPAPGSVGLGTGYLTYGPQELFAFPLRTDKLDFGTRSWVPDARIPAALD